MSTLWSWPDMTHRLKVAALALAFPLLAGSMVACTEPEEGEVTEATDVADVTDAAEEQNPAAAEVSPTSTIGRPAEAFHMESVAPSATNEIKGERVEDPAMELSYKWQGTSSAPGGGAVVVVAITNESEAPLPADALQPELRYNAGNNDMRTATALDAQAAGVDIAGLDLPLGPGATVNAKYPFDVSPGNLWDAAFTIGNVTFEGNLNN